MEQPGLTHFCAPVACSSARDEVSPQCIITEPDRIPQVSFIHAHQVPGGWLPPPLDPQDHEGVGTEY